VLRPLAVAKPNRRRQLRRQLALLVVGHGLPVEVQRAHKRGALARVVALEAQAEQHGLDAREAPPQVLGRRERQPQDEVAVVVLLALRVQLRVARAAGVEREVLVEERLHVQRRLGRGLVAEGACFEFGEDCVCRGVVSCGDGCLMVKVYIVVCTHPVTCRWPIAQTARA
jgi:hypothetical protein